MPLITRPGDILAYAIEHVTGEAAANKCSCGARQQQMNEWGWFLCLINIKTIAGWLTEEANKRGYDIEGDALGFLEAAIRAYWKKD